MGLFDARAELKRLVETGREAARRASERVQRAVGGEAPADVRAESSAIEATRSAALQESGPEPPVVARMIVEIRSDGTHTIARGALEDLASGHKVAIRADGTSPAQLAASLARTLVTLPAFAARIARSLKQAEPASPSDDDQPR